MVFGLHRLEWGAVGRSGGHGHDHHHNTETLPSTAAAADRLYTCDASATVISLAAAGTSHEHHVLINGHAIKHRATHRGYATADDGVRLYFEVFESHSNKQPENGSSYNNYITSGGGAPGVVQYGVRATAGVPSDLGQARLAPNRELTGSPYRPEPSDPSHVTTSPASSALESLASYSGAPASAERVAADPKDAVVVMPSGRPQPALRSNVVTSTRGSEDATAALQAQDGAVREGCAGAGAAHGPRYGSLGTEAPSNPLPAKAATGVMSACLDELDGSEAANVLLIMGFAAGRHGWLPLIQHWMEQANTPRLHRLRARFCVFDNRGIGDSDSPPSSDSYSTSIMARDALAVMDHLGWRQAHVVGFSMGGMIALRLAVAAPDRLLSLTALSVTNGGWQIVPTRWRALKLLLGAAMARTPHQRAHADVHFHFSRDTLHMQIPAPKGSTSASKSSESSLDAAQVRSVEASLIKEYVATSEDCVSQPHAGLVGQLHAVWTHGLSISEQHALRHLGAPFKVIHGYHDIMAMPTYGERIARHARAPFIMLNGGHFIARECTPEVCMHIADSVASVQKFK